MLHAFDTSVSDHAMRQGGAVAHTVRPGWLALLARAPMALLERELGPWADHPVHWLRQPETGLVMARGRVGGTGEQFNLGEVTVTRCALRLSGDGPMGVGYVMGRSHRQSRLIATADALLQSEADGQAWKARLLEPIQALLNERARQSEADARSTQVDFFTVAREAGNGSDEEDSE
jgi:alpha-D-ribose 1-methylphosphonate 5-triphosphate synthase subunit PhnG